MRYRALLALASCVLIAPTASAHFHMLLPDRHAVKRGEAVTLTYQWGHPFEHQLFDADKPAKLVVIAPGGKRTDLTDKLEKITLKGDKGKKVVAYRLRFTPRQRGDFVFVAEAAPVWLAEDEAFVRDTAKVVVHVQAQKGWDSASREEFELVPLTRPYGLVPGLVFQAEIRKPAGFRGVVEVERYNAVPPKVLPPDEQITRTVKTDPNGVVTTTLPDAGWWSLTATRPQGTLRRAGKDCPVRQRCTLWVWVAEKSRTSKRG
jgi:cobalt/nickel transport protein